MVKKNYISGKIGNMNLDMITQKKFFGIIQKKMKEGEEFTGKIVKKNKVSTRDTTKFKESAQIAKQLSAKIDEKNRKGTYKIFMGKLLQKKDIVKLNEEQQKIWDEYEKSKIIPKGI